MKETVLSTAVRLAKRSSLFYDLRMSALELVEELQKMPDVEKQQALQMIHKLEATPVIESTPPLNPALPNFAELRRKLWGDRIFPNLVLEARALERT
jgi:hypothetical protein